MNANPTTVAALKILREARALIESGEERFMCIALYDAGKRNKLSDRMADRVMASIHPHYTLDSWAESRGVGCDHASMNNMRLAYLDAWIAKHEKAIAKQMRGAK